MIGADVGDRGSPVFLSYNWIDDGGWLMNKSEQKVVQYLNEAHAY